MAQNNSNQQDPNRNKFNPDNIPPKGDDPQRKKSRFNIYWVYGLLFIGIVVFNLYRNVSSAGVDTSFEAFKEMLKQGDVEEYKIIRNKKLVRITLNKDSLTHKAAFYKKLLNTSKNDKAYEDRSEERRVGKECRCRW